MEDKPTYKADYTIYKGIWEYGENRQRNIVEDYNRLIVHTERFSDWLKEKTGKEIPVGKKVKLTPEERRSLQDLIKTCHIEWVIGIIGAAEPKNYDWYENFYHGVSYPLTDELEDYDLIYNEL